MTSTASSIAAAADQMAWPVELRVATYRDQSARLIQSGRTSREGFKEYGSVPSGPADRSLIDMIESAGLRGRGGAAFPLATKLRAVADRPGPRVIVANGEEGEPASVKDRWLLRFRPHLVLDGLLQAARAIDASRAIVYASDREAGQSIRDALIEHPDADAVELVEVAPAYVAGEETAAIRAIDGGPALPRAKPPRPFESGVADCPTVVSNVETLANIPWIAAHGSVNYRELGTAESPGTFLLTVSGACDRPGLYEVPFGISLGQALDELAGIDSEPVGFLMGGFFGGLLAPHAANIPLDYDAIRDIGSGLGCGSVIVLGNDDCPVAAAAELAAYFERESAKQCGACIRGTAAMRDVLIAATAGALTPDQVKRLDGWSMSLRRRGACALLDGAAGVAASLLREYPGLIEEHIGEACPKCAAHAPATSGTTRFALAV